MYFGPPTQTEFNLWMASNNKKDDSVQLTIPLSQLIANNWVGTYNFNGLGNCQQCPVRFNYNYRRPVENIVYGFVVGAITTSNAYGTLVITNYDSYYNVISGSFNYIDKGSSTPSLLPAVATTRTGYWYPMEINLKGTFTNVPVQK